MGHKNLDSNINRILDAQEDKPRLKLKLLPEGASIKVETVNSTYRFTKLKDGSFMAQGGKYLPNPTPVYINGSTYGGSMIKAGVIELDAHMEITIMISGKTITTSSVQEIYLENKKLEGEINDSGAFYLHEPLPD
jgi:hypothetical protein